MKNVIHYSVRDFLLGISLISFAQNSSISEEEALEQKTNPDSGKGIYEADTINQSLFNNCQL